MFSTVSGSRVFTRCATVANIYALSLHAVMMGVLGAIEFLVFFGCSRFYLMGQIIVFVHAVLTIAGFYLLGQIFVFVHAVLAIACFYLLGQIFLFVHAVLAIACFYLLGQIFVFVHAVLAIACFYLLGQIFVFVHAVVALACFYLLGKKIKKMPFYCHLALCCGCLVILCYPASRI